MAGWTCAGCSGDNPDGTLFCGHCGSRGDATLPPPTPVAVRQRMDTSAQSAQDIRWVTALFADLSGYSTLSESLSPEDLLEIMGPVIARLSGVVGTFGGYVDKYAGDAILALFGAPVAHEDDPLRALLAAQAMHEEIATLARTLPEPARGLALHIGVNSGDVVTGIIGSSIRLDYAAMGDAVNTAQRLEAAAPTGQTYVGQATYELTRGNFAFEEVGPLTVKGKTVAVQAWRLVGELADEVARPAADSAIVGRAGEVEQLQRLLEQVADGSAASVGVVGEAGSGKTRLAQAAQAIAQERGFGWLRARCLSYGGDLAYWPFADLLRRHLLPTTTGADLAELSAEVQARGLDEALPYLARLLGLDAGATDLEPEAFRRGLHAAVAEVLRQLAHQQPVVLHVEDLHWGDASSLDLLADLQVSLANEPVLFYASSRDAAPLTLAGIDHVVQLTALGVDDLEDMLRSLLGGDPAPDLVFMVRDRTGGNPFFVEEVVRALTASHALALAGGRWQLADPQQAEALPRTVQAVLAARLDALPPADVQVLHAASVLGRQPDLRILEEVAAGAGLAVDRLIQARFLRHSTSEPGAFVVFEHALTQEVVYNRMLQRHRRGLHLKVAATAERLYGSTDATVDLLARHYYRGGAGREALDTLRRSATRARQLFANREAIAQSERAAEVCRTHPELSSELPAALLEIASLHDLVGNYEDALRIYTEARDLSNELSAWCGMAAVLRRLGDGEAALAVIEEAEIAVSVADLRPLWLEKGWCLGAALSRYEEAVAVIEAALAAGAARDDAVWADLHLQHARNLVALGRIDEAMLHGKAAQEVFAALDHSRGLCTTLRVLGQLYIRTDRGDEAVTALTQGLALAERMGAVEEVGACLINLGMVEMELGRVEKGAEHDRRAIGEFESIGHVIGLATATTNLAEKMLMLGAYTEAADLCERGLQVAVASNLRLITADGHQTLAAIRLKQGLYEEAIRAAEAAAAIFEEIGERERELASATLAAEARRALAAQ